MAQGVLLLGHLSIPTTALSLLKFSPISASSRGMSERPAKLAKAFAAVEAMGTVLFWRIELNPCIPSTAIDAGAAEGLIVVIYL